MSGPIKLLCEIQTIDIEMENIEKERGLYLKDIESAGVEVKGLEEEIEALKKELEGIKAEVRDREDRSRQNGEKIEKDQKRLNEVKNEKQLAAVNKEITAAQKANKLIEIEISALVGKAGDMALGLAEKEKALEEKMARRKALDEELKGKGPGWEDARREKETRRSAVSSSLNQSLLKRYETIKSRRAGVGIVNVKNETCLGCYIQIPPQVYIQLKKGLEEIITCPHCHRILYCDNSPAHPSAVPSMKA
ncbi:MAG: hypothetical protein HY890_08980 [Deltaproteobacteria bacterium]|nr:hypothetical protein [Deltaproteobacteria bacterium]